MKLSRSNISILISAVFSVAFIFWFEFEGFVKMFDFLPITRNMAMAMVGILFIIVVWRRFANEKKWAIQKKQYYKLEALYHAGKLGNIYVITPTEIIKNSYNANTVSRVIVTKLSEMKQDNTLIHVASLYEKNSNFYQAYYLNKNGGIFHHTVYEGVNAPVETKIIFIEMFDGSYHFLNFSRLRVKKLKSFGIPIEYKISTKKYTPSIIFIILIIILVLVLPALFILLVNM